MSAELVLIAGYTALWAWLNWGSRAAPRAGMQPNRPRVTDP
jgi:hypothetical protein